MTNDDQHLEALAENLIETLGSERAVQVANQFGWYGVAEEIQRRQGMFHNAGPELQLATYHA